jgi:hypothetical protein
VHQHHRELEDDGWLNVEQAAKLLGKKEQTLANWRSQGKGPKYTKNGSEVRYRREWIDEYMYAGVVDPCQQNKVAPASCEASKRKAKMPESGKRGTKTSEANNTTPARRTRKFGGYNTKRKQVEATRSAS